MVERRLVQVSEILAHLAGDYFARESNRQTLMTVTRSEMSPDYKNITIFFSVLPEAMEESARAFAKRSRSDFREFVKKNSALQQIPTIDFEIDIGEKNRQRVDQLTRK